jgi:hypothetical protein
MFTPGVSPAPVVLPTCGGSGKNFSARIRARSMSLYVGSSPSWRRSAGICGSACGLPATFLLHLDNCHSPLLFEYFWPSVISLTRRLQFARETRPISFFNWRDRLLKWLRSSCWWVVLWIRLARLAPASSSDASGDQSGLALRHGLAFGQYCGRSSSRDSCRLCSGHEACCQSIFRSASARPSESSFWSAYRLRPACLLTAF